MGIKEFWSNLKPWKKGLVIGIVLDAIYALLYQVLWHSLLFKITSPFYIISKFFGISFGKFPIYGFTIYGLIIGLIISKLNKKGQELTQK